MEIGEKIKAHLKLHGLTITRFAEEIGENRSLVTNYLNEKQQPSVKFLYKVIGFFPDLDLNYLFRGSSYLLGEASTVYQKSPQKLIRDIEDCLEGIKHHIAQGERFKKD